MLLDRGAQRNNRRRRVIHETLLRSTPPTEKRTRRRSAASRDLPGGRSENYGDAEFLEAQPRLSDLIPTRRSHFAFAFVAGAGLVAGIERLYLEMPRMAEMVGCDRIAAFDLAQRGTLATWLSSLVLLLAAAFALLVYSIRRHKRDDYHGYYRVWLWAALGWLLLSLDTTTGLRHGFAGLAAAATGTRLHGDGAVWWAICYGFLIGGVGARLAVDMRSCLLSTGVFLLACGCYGTAVAARFDLVRIEEVTQQVMLLQGCVLSANLLILMSMSLHARHVLLDAKGLLHRETESVSTRSANSAERRLDLRGKATPGDEDDAEEEEEAATESPSAPVVVHPAHKLAGPKSPAAEPNKPAVVAAKPASPVKPPPAAATPSPVSTTAPSITNSTTLAGGLSKPAAPAATPPVQRKLTKQEKRALQERLERRRQQQE